MFQVSRCSAPVAILPEIWQPSIFIEHLKDKKMGAIDILELNSTEDRFNVNTKSFLDITISCPMNFAKFPFDNQKCTFKMILDEILDPHLTLHTQNIALMFGDGFKSSEQSYEYEVWAVLQ